MSQKEMRLYRHGIIVAVVVLSVSLVIAWIGATPVPPPPAQGTGLHRPNEPIAVTDGNQPTLRVATFNIHSGFSRDGKWNLERTASVLRNFDIVGLNEVRGFPLGYNNARTLGEALDMPWLFAPTERRWWFDEFGNGVLCRLPVERWQRTSLPGGERGYGFRNVLQLTVPWRGKLLNLFITHFDTRSDRVRQLQVVGAMFAATSPPVILMGDLNTTARDPALRAIFDLGGAQDALGAKLARPGPNRIDWILTRGLETVAAGIEEQNASDHSLVWAELRLP